MSEKKRVKQALKSVWDRLKVARDERAKLYDAADVLQSAHELSALANELRLLGAELSARGAMPTGAPLVTGVEPKTDDEVL